MIAMLFLSIALPKCRGVARKIFALLRSVVTLQHLVAVWKTPKLLDNVRVQFGEQLNGFEGFFVGRRYGLGQASVGRTGFLLHLARFGVLQRHIKERALDR